LKRLSVGGSPNVAKIGRRDRVCFLGKTIENALKFTDRLVDVDARETVILSIAWLAIGYVHGRLECTITQIRVSERGAARP
jgi:hypothetical protein